MLRHEYGPLLNLPGAEELAARLFDICEFLSRLHGEGKTAVRFKPLHLKVAYFAPCHMKALNIGLPALELIRLVPGLDVRLLAAECCGLGGLYGFKKEKYAITEEIGKSLAKDVSPDRPRRDRHRLRRVPDAAPCADRSGGPPPRPAPPRRAGLFLNGNVKTELN